MSEVVPKGTRLHRSPNAGAAPLSAKPRMYTAAGVPSTNPNYQLDVPLPAVLNVEEAVLGSMLIDNGSIPRVRKIVNEALMFYRADHQYIYEAICNLSDAGMPADVVTVTERLQANGRLQTVGGGITIAALSGETATSANAEFYAGIVLECWRRRQTIRTFTQRIAELSSETSEVTSVVSKAVNELQRIQARGLAGVHGEQPSYRGRNIYNRRRAGILRRLKHAPILTGFSALDRKFVDPFFPGGVTVIAARPSVGKSTLKANLNIGLCEGGFGVLSVTPEQGFDREMDRLDSIYTGIPLSEIKGVRSWRAGDPRVKLILNANGNVYSDEWNFCIMPRRDISWADIESQVLADKLAGWATSVVFIDLLDRCQEIRAAVRGDKPSAFHELLLRASEFAQREQLHVCALAQISREARLNDDKRPSLETIKGSGGWEEIADNVLLLHSPADNELDIIIGKQRDGEAGNSVVVRLPFNRGTLRLGNRDYQNVNDPQGVSRLSLHKPTA